MTALAAKVLQVADSLKGLRELTNHNDHPMIDRMLDYLGLPHGLSWCLAFCVWCFHSAVMPAPNPLPKIARCSAFWSHAQQHPLRYRVVSDPLKAQPGDVAIFSHHPERKNWDGHAALVVAGIDRRSFRTIEGNTVAGAQGNQREGGGVYYRTRTARISGLVLQGFVRPL